MLEGVALRRHSKDPEVALASSWRRQTSGRPTGGRGVSRAGSDCALAALLRPGNHLAVPGAVHTAWV